jgi:transcriptional regulator with XRE-family HTH domain
MIPAKEDSRYQSFRTLLKEAREARGITQLALGKQLEKDQLWVSRYESGRRQLDVIEFLAVAQAIGVDPCRLLRKLVADSPAGKGE